MQNQASAPDGGAPTLQETLDKARRVGGGVLDDSPGYEPVTEAQAEAGIFRLVAGYADENGIIHDEVELRAMTGNEEDLLGNDKIPFLSRINSILANCVKRIGTITDQGQIHRAVSELPSGARTHLLILLRVVTHWKAVKDEYEMTFTCPQRGCGRESTHKIDLLSLDQFTMADPRVMITKVKLPDSGSEVSWCVMTGWRDHVLDVVVGSDNRGDLLSHAILVRLVDWDGERVELGVDDFLAKDMKKMRMSKNAMKLLKRVKGLTVGDRETLRASFLDKEPGIDTDVEVECPGCGVVTETTLVVGQPGFFFPQAISRRSKRRSST